MIGEDFYKITEGLDPDAVGHLSKKWSDLKTLLEDPDRISVIAKDLVTHFNDKKENRKRKSNAGCVTKPEQQDTQQILFLICQMLQKCICIISGSVKSHPEEINI